MRPTKLANLVLIFIGSGVATYFIVRFLVLRGSATPISPMTLLVTLPVIGLVVLGLAYPIWNYRRALKTNLSKQGRSRPKRVDPFYAVQVVLLAKATAIAGALFSGWHLGTLIWQLGSPVIAFDSALRTALGLIGSLVMASCGYLAELICKLRDDPDSASTKNPGTAPA